MKQKTLSIISMLADQQISTFEFKIFKLEYGSFN